MKFQENLDRMYEDLACWSREWAIRNGSWQGTGVLPYTSTNDVERTNREWRWAKEGLFKELHRGEWVPMRKPYDLETFKPNVEIREAQLSEVV